MTAHTPRPWKVVKSDTGFFVETLSARIIADVDGEANARLIAAAPDMKALLERGSQIMEEAHPGWVKAARALLAKIEENN